RRLGLRRRDAHVAVRVSLGVSHARRQACRGGRVSARRCGGAVRCRHAGAGDDARRRRGRHRPRDRPGNAAVTALTARDGPSLRTPLVWSAVLPLAGVAALVVSREPARELAPPTYRVTLIAAPAAPRQV